MLLNPKSRVLPREYNSQAVEQLWQKVVKVIPSLNFFKEGRFRFMLLSLYQIWNMRQVSIAARGGGAGSTAGGADNRRFKREVNRGKNKHKLRSRKQQKTAKMQRSSKESTASSAAASAAAASASSAAAAAPPPPPAAVPGEGWASSGKGGGRLPVPECYLSEMPLGFDPRMSERLGGDRRRFSSVPIALFRDNEDALLGLVRQYVPASGAALPNQTFAARMALQKWMIAKLVEEGG